MIPSHPIHIVPAGDEAVLIQFGVSINRRVQRRVHGFIASLELGGRPEWLVELVPAYSSLLVRYEPDRITYPALLQTLRTLATHAYHDEPPLPNRVEIAVHYGGADGPDLAFVAAHCGMSESDVIRLHSEPVYVVYMLGFTPGFCYLGDLPPQLVVPRRATPRLTLPAGAVAIGGTQTGVYSLDNSPGGWRWIGRTDVSLWDGERDPPFRLQAGDEVRFVPV